MQPLMLKPNGQGLYMMPERLGSHHCATNFNRVCFALHNVFFYGFFLNAIIHFNYLYMTLQWILAGGQRVPLSALYDDTLP